MFKGKQGQKVNPRTMGGSDPEILREGLSVQPGSTKERILAPGEVVDLSSGRPQTEIKFAEDFLRIRTQELQSRPSDALRITAEYNQQRQELQSLSASRPTEETQKVLAQNETDPGTYDVNFLHRIITLFRGSSLQDAGTWLRAFVGRGNKRNPWKKYQDNEGTFLHPESYVSRQTA